MSTGGISTWDTSFPWELLFCLVIVFLSYLNPIHIVHSSKSKKNLFLFYLHVYTLIISIALLVLADTFTCCRT